MTSPRLKPGVSGTFAVVALLLGFMAVALFLRSYFVHDQVFRPDFTRFQENDPWYHVRAIEHLIANFPHRLTWDPYALHPGGQHVAIGPLFDWIAAGIALLLGSGTPSSRLTHAVCAWLPAVWGALTVIPAYFMGKVMRDPQTGLLSAATIAVLPGLYLRRSSLGYVDHHVAESFLSLLTILFLMVIFLPNNTWNITDAPGSMRTVKRWRFRRTLSAILCGLSLGCYLLAWVGGSLLVLTLVVAISIQMVVESARGHGVHRNCAWIAGAWVIALVMVFPFRRIPGFTFHVVALTGSLLFLVAAGGLGWLIERRRLRRAFFPIGLLVLAVAGLILLRFIRADIFAGVFGSIARFISGHAGTFIIEARPLLYDGGSFTLRPTWEMFQSTALTAILATGLLFYRNIRSETPGGVIVLVWTIGVVLATLTQERFAYYLAVNIAVLSAYFWGSLLEVLARRSTKAGSLWRWKRVAISYALILAIGLFPSARMAYLAAQGLTGPHPDWFDAMGWLQRNSPEPFDSPEYFGQRYDISTDGRAASRPQAMYGVMCSWDYGYWITGMARRVPTANPTQSGLNDSAAFFAARNEDDAAQILARLTARYVVIDETLPVWHSPVTNEIEGAFGTIARLAGHDEFELYEPYLEPKEDGTYKPVILYYPEYYRSMLNRLYLFGAREYVPEWTTWAVRASTITTAAGDRIKRIERGLKFKTYETALRFVGEHSGEPWRIVGLTPAESCVPLEPLRRFQRIYKSPTQTALTNVRPIGVVEIFEFTPP